MYIKKPSLRDVLPSLLPRAMLVLAALALAGPTLAASTTVTYVKPETFTDMPLYQPQQERVLKALTEHFDKLGATLPPGQALAITVTNIDLAGRLDMMHRMGNDDLRIMNGGADWPRIELHYALTDQGQGQVLAGGDAQVADMMYLQRVNRYPSGDPQRYEKAMLDDWFYKQFPSAKH